MVARVMISGVWRPIGEARRLLNHPGHSSQKSHGRGGGTGQNGVRDALADAKTTGAIGAAASAEAKRITGRDIEFDLAGSDPQIAREHAEGVLRGLEEFPGTPLQQVRTGAIEDIQGHEEAWASTSSDGSVITLAPVSPSAVAAHRENLARLSNRQPREFTVATPMGLALHEAGHATANGLRLNNAGVSAARKHVETVMQDDDYRAAVGYSISTRAMKNGYEMVAEAFADVVANGSGASDLSHVVVDAMHTAGG